MSFLSIPTALLTTATSGIVAHTLFQAMRNKLQEKGVAVITVEDAISGEIKEIPVANLEDFEEMLVEQPTENLRAREGELPSAEAQDVSMQAIVAARTKAAELRDERMRQAKFTFNAALILSVIGASIIFIGIGLLLFRDASIAGVLSAATGAVIEVISAVLFRFNSQTNNRLDEIGKDLSAIETAQIAMVLIEKIEDPGQRDEAIREAASDLRARS